MYIGFLELSLGIVLIAGPFYLSVPKSALAMTSLPATSYSDYFESGENGLDPLLNLVIRSATSWESEPLASLLLCCFHGGGSFNDFLAHCLKSNLARELTTRLNRPAKDYLCLLAYLDGKLVATVEMVLKPIPSRYQQGFSTDTRHYVYVSNLAVHPRYRRLGIAQRMLHQVEAAAVGWHQPSIRLHVLNHNRAALKLYQSCGYRLEREELDWSNLLWPRFGGKWLMKKRLPEPRRPYG
jgi:ribosomal protein S18 acetylase RimI-like enzyme